MSTPIISVKGLGKRYRIGGKRARYHTLRESLVNATTGLWKTLRGAGGGGKREDFWALKDVSFDVQPGEVVGIIGRNGAGKSTLLKILSEITEPTEGRAELRGRVGSLLEVGTGFHPELTGRENIYLSGAILGMKKAEIDRKFDEIVDFSGVEKFLDTPAKRYSSGMYVRLGFAVAAHLEPEILVIDEVLAVGDAEFQKKCLGKMGDVAKSGRTVLFVSHNMVAVRRLCSCSVLLEQGRVLASGSTEEVISTYLTKGVQSPAERYWEDLRLAPGNQGIKLHGVRVLDETGKPCHRHDIRRPVRVEILFRIQQEKRGVVPGFHLFDNEGNCLFMSYDHNRPEWQEQIFDPGPHSAVCEIPGNFLAEGRFTVTVAINVEVGQSFCHVLERDAVGFEVFDPCEGDSVRGPNSNTWGGVVRPMLRWTTVQGTG
jgi:homopolymeric O-antigen transport system ATP-binding protein